MKICKIENHEVEDFLNHHFSSPTHWPEWNLLVQQHFHSNFYYLGAREDGILKGICPVHKTKFKKFLFRLQSGQFQLIPNGGWIFSEPHTLGKHFFPASWNEAHQTFTLPLLGEFNVINGHHTGQVKKTLIIDLNKSLDEIWSQDIHSKRRNMIRKAEKEGLEVREMRTEGDLSDFYSLYAEATRRFSNNPLTIDFFKHMFFDFQHVELNLFSAYQENKQLASVGIISDKNYSIYWLGSNDLYAKNRGQGELLQWHAIGAMKNKGCRYYDLCYIEPEKLPNIYKFKKGFSKDEYNVLFVNHKSFPFRIFNKVLL